eukprot:TRINITY_DN226_c0_g2_i1.p1 TRINITY_DN226_c0_g2~~TRINITY_DN226_c0_g2_i1.p1  ORF type:complete len:1037 (+),score=182.28 TRINITY_DN226_c0_g2_i1:149-3259(+)
MASGDRLMACFVVFMSIAIAWRSSASLGWSSIQQSSLRQNTLAGSRHQPRSRKGIFSSVAAEATSQGNINVEEESDVLQLLPGQQVVLLGPSKLAGKMGTIVASASDDTFAVRLDSDKVVHIQAESIKGAQRRGDIFNMLSSVKQTFIQRASRFKSAILQTAAPTVSAPSLYAGQTAEATSATSSSDHKPPADAPDYLGFAFGQPVIVLGPPKLVGTKGTVVGAGLGDALAVQLQSGTIFHILAENLHPSQAEGPVLTHKIDSGLKRSPNRQPQRPKASATATQAEGMSSEVGVDTQDVLVSARPASALDAVQSPGQKSPLQSLAAQADLKKKVMPEVILYGRDSCRWCSTLSSEYRKNGIKYRKVDVSERPNQREMWSKVRAAGLGGGKTGLPVVDVAGTVRVRPTAVDVKRILSAFGSGGADDKVTADLTTAFKQIKDADESLGSVCSEDAPIDKLDGSNEDEAQQRLKVDDHDNGCVDADEIFRSVSSDSSCDMVEELEFSPGQEVIVLAPPTLAGKTGIVNGPVSGDTCAVRLESGSIFQIPTTNLRNANQAAGPGFFGKMFNHAKRATSSGIIQKLLSRFKQAMGRQARRPITDVTAKQAHTQDTQAQAQVARESTTSLSAAEKSTGMGEMELAPGQRVVVLGPPAAAGKKASILSRVPGGGYDVQLESGSVFRIAASNLQTLSDRNTSPVGGGDRAGGGSGKGRSGSGQGGGGEGMPPGSIEGGQPDPESGDGASWLWWLAFAIMAALMVIFAKRRGRRNNPWSRASRQPFVHTFAPASMNPMLALLVLGTAVSALLIIKLALWARKEMPGVMKTVVSRFRSALASIFEVTEQEELESLPTPEAKEAASSRLYLVGLLLFLIVVANIVANWRKHKAWLGKGKTEGFDHAVTQRRRILRQLEPEAEEPPKPHEDSPEVHFRCIMLVAKCRLFLAGDCESIDAWDPVNSIAELKSDNLSHPVWTGKWYPRAEFSSREFRFKLVLLRPDGQVLWEVVESRKLLVSPREKLSVEITFNCAGMQVTRDFKAVDRT